MLLCITLNKFPLISSQRFLKRALQVTSNLRSSHHFHHKKNKKGNKGWESTYPGLWSFGFEENTTYRRSYSCGSTGKGIYSLLISFSQPSVKSSEGKYFSFIFSRLSWDKIILWCFILLINLKIVLFFYHLDIIIFIGVEVKKWNCSNTSMKYTE